MLLVFTFFLSENEIATHLDKDLYRENKTSPMVIEQQQTSGMKERANMPPKSKSLIFTLIPVSVFSFILFIYYSYLLIQSYNFMNNRTSIFISLNIISLFLFFLSKSPNTESSIELQTELPFSTSLEAVEQAIDEAPADLFSFVLEKEECFEDNECIVVVEEVKPREVNVVICSEDKECIVVVEEVKEREVNVVILNEEGDGELEFLGINELNERFEEFIRREKNKWRMEATKVCIYLDNGKKIK